MTTQPKLITYQDYLAGPEIKQRKEIVDGKLIMFGPMRPHQIVLGNVYRPVWAFVDENGMGEVLMAPSDVIVQRDPLRVRQPDIEFTSNERAYILGDRIEGGHDLVVEILSPSNTRAYVAEKLADYAGINVRECWLIALNTRTVEVLHLEDGQWRTAYTRGEGEILESAVLPGLELDIAGLFRGV